MITQPGVYDIDAETYHADPVPGGSLSSTGARLILRAPALYHYSQTHQQPYKAEFSFGHAAHKLVLGEGAEIVIVDADDWRTQEARDARDEALADGKTPLLEHDHEHVQAMAAAIREHPIAGALFQPGTGEPERSLFWRDAYTDVWCRARLDWLPHPGPRRMLVADYKTTHDASLEAIVKSIHAYGYFQQAHWYLDGVRALGLADDAAFLFVFQEKSPPYLVTVVELDQVALGYGRELNRRALEIYRDCKATDTWPGYSDTVELVGLPGWLENRLNRRESW